MRQPAAPSPRVAVDRLIEQEATLDAARRSGGTGYSPAHHVEVLIALIAESRLLTRPGQQA